jgi:hypothetical protein
MKTNPSLKKLTKAVKAVKAEYRSAYKKVSSYKKKKTMTEEDYENFLSESIYLARLKGCYEGIELAVTFLKNNEEEK